MFYTYPRFIFRGSVLGIALGLAASLLARLLP